MAFMISVVHKFVNNDCTTYYSKTFWMKLKSYNNQKNLTTASEKKISCEEKKIIQQSSPFLYYKAKQKNNEKILKFGLTYLKRTSYVLEKYI
jgi:hypothetical protein